MKKTALLLISLILAVGVLSACGNNAGNNGTSGGNATATPAPTATTEPTEQPAGETQGYQDGSYFAEAADYSKSGWKEVVALKVEGGKIVSANWNALYKDGGLDKKQSSLIGQYGMKAGGASAEWHEQAIKVEQFLIEQQSLDSLALKEGKTDAVSGVSITVSGFEALVNQALEAGPVAAGPYKDGTYTAEAAEFSKSGWKDNATVTVMNGNIVAASWNAVHKDGGVDKKTSSIDGVYGMKAGGASSEWHEQAYLTEQYLLETQDPAKIAMNDNGKTDAISGVSVTVSSFVELASKALEGAK